MTACIPITICRACDAICRCVYLPFSLQHPARLLGGHVACNNTTCNECFYKVLESSSRTHLCCRKIRATTTCPKNGHVRHLRCPTVTLMASSEDNANSINDHRWTWRMVKRPNLNCHSRTCMNTDIHHIRHKHIQAWAPAVI